MLNNKMKNFIKLQTILKNKFFRFLYIYTITLFSFYIICFYNKFEHISTPTKLKKIKNNFRLYLYKNIILNM